MIDNNYPNYNTMLQVIENGKTITFKAIYNEWQMMAENQANFFSNNLLKKIIEENRSLSYFELATDLVNYLKEMNYVLAADSYKHILYTIKKK